MRGIGNQMGLLEVLGMARQLGGDPEVIEAVLQSSRHCDPRGFEVE